MQIQLPLTEALSLALAAKPLPPMVLAVRASGASLEADIDAGAVTGGGGLRGLMGKMAGTVTATATFTSFAAGTAVFGVRAQARGMAVESMIGQFSGTLQGIVRRAGLPADVVELREGAAGPELLVHVQRAVDAKVSGVTVTDLVVADGVAHVAATVGDARVL